MENVKAAQMQMALHLESKKAKQRFDMLGDSLGCDEGMADILGSSLGCSDGCDEGGSLVAESIDGEYVGLLVTGV